ncbi:uncharacterized protein LOC21412191 isoform X2 [Morus notabilis]|uniref:uncharacterized protein LOC21412191 isoform X2 n=1 Tax=Morus notabilis TaxID=981085 RepID=UPI000CECF39D|nr:uncharacterized protein LOC21412191 isoform X2 [Morus notabilis]
MASMEGLEPITVSPQKQDPGWKHCQVFVKNDENSNGVVNKVELKKCLYCGKMFQGGGIHRLKEHLAGRKGNGPICDRAPEDVRIAMQQHLENNLAVKRQKKKQTLVVVNQGSSELDDYSLSNRISDSALVVRGGDVGISSRSVDMDGVLLGTLRNSLPVSSGGVDVVKGVEFSDNALLEPSGEPDSKFSFSHKEDVGMSVERRFRLRDVNSSIENIGAGFASNVTKSSHNPAGITLRENSNSFAEHAQQRLPLVSLPHSDVLVNREEVKIGNPSATKRKRLIDENSYAGEEAGILSNDLELERINSQRRVHVAIGRFLYEIGASLDAVKESVYFQPMIDVIASGSSGVIAPSYHDLRGWILKDVVEEVRNDIDQCTARWEKTGCSLLASQWNSGKGRSFLNFSVYCPEGTIFLKSADVSDIIQSPDALHNLFQQVIEEVGVKHILQVITNSEEQYIVVGKRLMETFPTLYWSPCAAHCIELMLEDFGKIEWIKSAIEQAKSVTRFIYKHTVVLNIMRSPWLLHRSGWAPLMQIQWKDPLLRALNIVGSKKRAAMGYVFAGIYRAKEMIKRELPKREDYMFYWNIIDCRWKNLWHHPLHTAGFYLNPKFFYSVEGDVANSIVSGVFDCIERFISDIEVQDRIVKEINLYKDAAGDLGRKLAIRARDTLLPAEWWSTYGGGCSFLSRFSVRLLSQTCSLVHHKSNQIPFEQLHETRNCLEHQRLNDLVFVQYNLQLRQMSNRTKVLEYADPLSFDRKSVVEDWIMEKEVNLEDIRSANWMSVDPPSVNSMLLELSNEEAEDLRAGFDDCEILNGLKEVKEEVINMMQ